MDGNCGPKHLEGSRQGRLASKLRTCVDAEHVLYESRLGEKSDQLKVTWWASWLHVDLDPGLSGPVLMLLPLYHAGSSSPSSLTVKLVEPR